MKNASRIIAFQLFILENLTKITKKVPIVKDSKINKRGKDPEFIGIFILDDHTSRYKKNKPIQMSEKIKYRRAILCFIGFSFVIEIFILNFNGKYKKKLVFIN
ncbi:hypothetical protein [Bacillus cereus]|uniref:hypothetical protein n=1 Tax=Bacillus cereus TaxID=1396 RepID=UPI0015964F38